MFGSAVLDMGLNTPGHIWKKQASTSPTSPETLRSEYFQRIFEVRFKITYLLDKLGVDIGVPSLAWFYHSLGGIRTRASA